MRNIITKGGVYLMNPFRSNEIALKKSIKAAFNENLTGYESSHAAYKALQNRYYKLAEKLLPVVEKNKLLKERVAEQQQLIKVLMQQLNGKNI